MTNTANKPAAHPTDTLLRVYLAGPEVFLPDAKEIGEAKKSICRAYGLQGVFPLDNDISEAGDPSQIARHIGNGNIDLLRGAYAVVANLTPFRGPSADVGTVAELIDAVAHNKVVAAYTNVTDVYRHRVEPDGMEVEDFGLFDNLMLPVYLKRAGTRIIQVNASHDRRYSDLSGFEHAIADIARRCA